MKKILVCFGVFMLLFSLSSVSFMASNDVWKDGDIVERSTLDENDPNYWVKIYDSTKKNARYSGLSASNFVPNENKLEMPTTRTTSATKYNVYSSSGSLRYSNLSSVFDAIYKASSSNDYVQETDTGLVVFRKNGSASTYYKFQFTKYYGTTTSASEVDNWINNFAYTHVFNGKGELVKNSYYAIRGTPDAYTLEPYGGGYYAKFSYAYEGYKSSYMKANLASAQMKFSATDENNGYIFQAIVTPTQTVEVGIMTGKYFDGDWVVYKSDPVDGFVVAYPNQVAASGTRSSSGVYTFSNDVELKLKVVNGGAVGTITSSILNYEIQATASSITTTASPLAFFHMVSFVHPEGFDMRNGAYLKNVGLSNCKLYKNNTFSGTAYNFYADSTGSVNFSYIYNEDVITYTKTSSTKETINIDYSVPYQE